ncbi:hypothetical protein EG329_001598 [Mollisiaceae sp. DMI_Dod_QoI]|nr:hypothetical protein EG329_001598 [Helotiales sp. DMI_Dod_QoI]
MVGVINPNDTETLAIQQAYAKNATLMFSPGEYFPSETLPTTSTTSTTSSATASATATTATTTPTAAASSSSSSLSGGAIAGIALGGAIVLIIGAALVYLCGRQRTLGEIIRHSQYAPPPPSYLSGPSHPSMTSSAAFSPKSPNIEVDALGFHQFSGQYDRSAAETESYRSRSPPVDEAREQMIPTLRINGSSEPTSPASADTPLMRRPTPQSLGREDGTSLMTALSDQYQPVPTEISPPLRMTGESMQIGPHELSVESDRNYLPYKSPEFRGEPGT